MRTLKRCAVSMGFLAMAMAVITASIHAVDEPYPAAVRALAVMVAGVMVLICGACAAFYATPERDR